MLSLDTVHHPVMLAEVLESLSPLSGVVIDCTFGGGGYTAALLSYLSPPSSSPSSSPSFSHSAANGQANGTANGTDSADLRVIALDRDPQAIERAHVLAQRFPARLFPCNSRFSNLRSAVAQVQSQHSALANEPITAVIFDLGLSSDQLSDENRGFAFSKKGPLDMRMGLNDVSAYDVINTYSEKEIADILFNYGEERFSRRIARNIVMERKLQPIQDSERLAKIIASSIPGSSRKSYKHHPATRSFQGLRIFVNRELEELEHGLAAAAQILAPQGKLVVVSFHSLEDRIVKNFLRGNNLVKFDRMYKKVVVATDEEIEKNPRARSAKLRAGIKLDLNDHDPVFK